MRPQLQMKYNILDDNYILKVIPNPIFSNKVTEKVITPHEARAILNWKETGCTIQSALPHWSAADRELLLTGLGTDEDFTEYLTKPGPIQA